MKSRKGYPVNSKKQKKLISKILLFFLLDSQDTF